MALANIFAKLKDLETRFEQLTSSTSGTSGVSVQSPVVELEAIISRVTALENQVNNNSQDINGRLSAVEARPVLPDLSEKLAALESRVIDTTAFLEKLNHIESVGITTLESRVSALEQQLATPL